MPSITVRALPPQHRDDISVTYRAPGRFTTFTMPLGAAYGLAEDLREMTQAILAGAPRPWDNDPGRVPFASRGRRGRRAEPAPRRVAADGGRPGGAAPGVRPDRRVDSGA